MTYNISGKVDNNLNATADGWRSVRVTPTGEIVVRDFLTDLLIDGYGFQVRAGTVTTPLVGDVVITDAAAEMAVDAPNGFTDIITELSVSLRLNTGTLTELAAKSVAGASSSGTAFVPLPLVIGGAAAASTARVQAAGAVTVTAELATTTRRHWSYASPVAAGAGNDPGLVSLNALRKPVILKGGATGTCFYVQLAATATGPSYYASIDFLELATSLLS